MTPSAALVRAEALVSRAAHTATPEEEARSCAVLACRLVSEHKLLAPQGTDKFRLAEDALRAANLRVERLTHLLESATKERDALRVEVFQLRAQAKTPAHREPARSDGEAVMLLSKYEGRCRVCQETYGEGERVAWKRGRGAVHAQCLPDWV